MGKLSNYDKWLTTDPNEANDAFVDSVVEQLSDKFFEQHEYWVDSREFTDLCFRFNYEDRTPKEIAQLIELQYEIIYNNPKKPL